MKKIVMTIVLLNMLGMKSIAESGAGHPPLDTVPEVDLNLYIGKWYEIASIPQSFQKKCVKNASAVYSFAEDNLVKVVNSCVKENGKSKVAEGRAKIVDTVTNSKLKVTFVKLLGWVFSFGGDYWITELAEDYSYAIVGHPSREYAWVLSRTPALPLEELELIYASLVRQGYDPCAVITSIQDGGFAERRPLCELFN